MSKLVAGVIGGLALLVGGSFAWSAFAKPRRKAVGAALPTVRLGSKGEAVRALQQCLLLAGHPGTLDGDFGPKTDALLRQWQAKVGLPMDGVAGPAVWAELAPAMTPTPAQQARIDKARSALGKKTKYVMGGKTGPGGELDCSGFIAWLLGVPRDKAGRVPSSIHTDAIVKDATGLSQGMFRRVNRPVPGCFVVYPDRPGQQGHAGLVTDLYPLKGIDCGSSHYEKTKDAIGQRDFSFFLSQNAIFCVPVSDQ